MNPGDELVDIVDGRDRFVRTATRSEMRAENLWHRAVAVLVLGTDGRLLIHRRAESKDVFPGYWDVAAGGVLAAGETYAEAALRELREELGVDARLTAIGAGQYEDGSTRYHARVYRAVHDGPFRFTDDEVVEVRWVTPPELWAMLDQHSFCPDGITMTLPLLDGWGTADAPVDVG